MASQEHKMREELLIRNYIDERLDDVLIPNIQSLLQKTNIQSNRRMGRAQFSSLQNVTRDTTSVLVIVNWLRYQIGRQAAWKDGDFGSQLLNVLENILSKEADYIAGQIIADLGTSVYDERGRARLSRRVWLLLIRQYVGQLQRAVLGYQGV